MDRWESFFVAEIGASAALAGLVFVGVSINLSKILAQPGLPNRALNALGVLISTLTVSSILLIPAQPTLLVGIELAVVGLSIWSATTFLQSQTIRKLEASFRTRYRWSLLGQVIIGQTATFPFLIAGIAVLLQGEAGVYWVAPAIIFSFIEAMLEAWILLVEINR